MQYNKLKILLFVVLFVLFGATQYFESFLVIDRVIHDNVMASERLPADNIIIVGIDERSINEIGTWPWPRIFVAEAISMLSEMGIAAIGVNVVYDALGAFPEYDTALVAAADGASQIVLGGMAVFSEFQRAGTLFELDDFVVPFDELENVTDVGFIDAMPDEDGVMRRALTALRLSDITVHSFPFEVYSAYRRAMGQDAIENIPLDRYGQFPIRFVGGPGSFRTVSLWGVIHGEYHYSMFRDAIVLIGPYAHGVGGLGEVSLTTPMDRGTATHGVELHANIIQNMLEGIFLVDAPWWLNLAVMVLSGLIVIVLFQWLKPVSAFIVVAVLVMAQLVGVRLVYNNLYMIVRVGDTIVFLGLCYIVNLVFSILSAQSEKQHIKELFGRFVSPDVVHEIISGGVDIQLGGVVKEITALFVDIRGFTAFSESNPPEKVVDIINRYLGLTSRSIQQNGGTIDKYIGDATMALFNAPNDLPNHALRAVKTAWDMKQGSVALRDGILEEYGVDLQFGIGINTGAAVVGNMGSDFRMDYTAIGDAVNTAARLESSAPKGGIIISDATYQQVKQYIDVVEIGHLSLKNKKEEVLVYSVENVRG